MRPMVVAFLAVSGCGPGAPDISGLYRTSTSMSDPTGCGPGASMATPLFFAAQKKNLLGAGYFVIAPCASADPSSCQAGFSLLIQPIADGWKGEIETSSGAAGSCTLGYSVETAVLTGSSLRYERRAFALPNAMVAACTTDEAARRKTEMPCSGYELLVGTRQ